MFIDLQLCWLFVLCTLATWRLTHLLAREDGPGDLIVRLRSQLGTSWLGAMMDCFFCLSLWVAVPLTWTFDLTWPASLLMWLAMSGAACLLERVSNWPNRHQPHL
ncbi:DUF1360 domain-containing protein [Leptothrix discophora]|uniref:DUF1360 domain-containing protein n=1 Tax=Leptothrix discophora TaxID=89 RepID=A0ABT9G3P4_LEPDI|nr:DUF1360 domain-containing protein [Leptothrix discophora]MDP4301077.1 DUF1360 domain-containing protein [Leptothrix discophora]